MSDLEEVLHALAGAPAPEWRRTQQRWSLYLGEQVLAGITSTVIVVYTIQRTVRGTFYSAQVYTEFHAELPGENMAALMGIAEQLVAEKYVRGAL